MSEVEKQESQKTVVAFISGLLIGGLLVWIFSSSPENAVAPEAEETNTEEGTEVASNENTDEATETESRPVVGEGSVLVDNQPAGNTVALSSLSLPTEKGWVVVREFTNAVPGNILGAARFSAEENLVPTEVELIRGTTAGNTYQVVFFTNDGDVTFSLTDDVMIEGIATTFNAN
jgi:hypothetical protein